MNLPWDLVEDILSRLPLKSMRAVRLTCKAWNTVSKSRKFTTKYLDKESAAARELGHSRVLVTMDHNLYLMSLVIVNENPYIEAKGTLTSLKKQVKIFQVINCEGILLCIFKNNIMVWNPYCGHTKWIKIINPKRYRFRYAIGYENKSCRNHKILRFVDDYISMAGSQFSLYEIYDVESGLWTSLDVTPHWRIDFGQQGVSLKGNTYWCAREENSNSYKLICFDFTNERFGPLLPLPFRASFDEDATLSCVGGEKLAVLFQSKETFVAKIWITTKIEPKKVLSWSMFFTMDRGHDFGLIEGSFFIDEEKKIAVVFDKDIKKGIDRVKIFKEDGYFRSIDLGEPSNKTSWPSVCSYVPSLMEIKLHERGKRKRQSTLEMLSLLHEEASRKREA